MTLNAGSMLTTPCLPCPSSPKLSANPYLPVHSESPYKRRPGRQWGSLGSLHSSDHTTSSLPPQTWRWCHLWCSQRHSSLSAVRRPSSVILGGLLHERQMYKRTFQQRDRSRLVQNSTAKTCSNAWNHWLIRLIIYIHDNLEWLIWCYCTVTFLSCVIPYQKKNNITKKSAH